MTLRVGYELTALGLDASGAARAVRRLRETLEARQDMEIVPFAHRGGAGLFSGLDRELRWFPWELPRRAARARVDLLHCPAPLAPPRSGAVPVVVTANDAMAWDHPEWFTRANAAHARLLLARALRSADRILVPSTHTRERLRLRVGLDPARIDVIPYGVDPVFRSTPPPAAVLHRNGIIGRYLLCVATLQPRKNLETALRVFERLAATHSDLRLVVAGGRGWRDARLVARLEVSPIRERVHAIGRVSDDELAGLYANAACVIVPSRAEGFGFPVLEAMACGGPVVCSDAAALPEIAGGVAALVSPDDTLGFVEAVRRFIDNDAVRQSARERGLEFASTYTWERCAELTVAAYGATLAQRRG